MVRPAVPRKGRQLNGPDLDDDELTFSLREVVEFNLEEMTEIFQELHQLQSRECVEAHAFRRFIYVLVVLLVVLGVVVGVLLAVASS